jgi:hypothetical protein
MRIMLEKRGEHSDVMAVASHRFGLTVTGIFRCGDNPVERHVYFVEPSPRVSIEQLIVKATPWC